MRRGLLHRCFNITSKKRLFSKFRGLGLGLVHAVVRVCETYYEPMLDRLRGCVRTHKRLGSKTPPGVALEAGRGPRQNTLLQRGVVPYLKGGVVFRLHGGPRDRARSLSLTHTVAPGAAGPGTALAARCGCPPSFRHHPRFHYGQVGYRC